MSDDIGRNLEEMINEGMDQIVERLAERITAAAREQGISEEDFEISELDKSDVKHIIRELVPHKPPVVSFMVSTILRALLQWAHDQEVIRQTMSDPEKLEEMLSELVNSSSAQDVLKKLEERQAMLGAQYREVTTVKGNKLKVADLEDVLDKSTISYN